MANNGSTTTTSGAMSVSFKDASWLWLKVGLLSFGGPAGQIALMHRYIVDERQWLSEGRFLHALNYCMLLPGPEAQQLAVYVGWLLHGIRGGLVAGLLFIIPGAIVIFALSFIYVIYAEVALVDGVFYGIKAAVLAIVLQAIIRMGSRVLKKPALLWLAIAGFVATFFLHVPFPLLILVVAAIGWLLGRYRPDSVRMDHGHGDGDDDGGETDTPSKRQTLKTAGLFALLWAIPIAVLIVVLGPDNVYTRISLFFSKLAIVTFGGAYAVLAYMTQQVVDNYQWLTTGQMIDGLGMAETTPGPLILVTQFVGFLAAYQNPGAMAPLFAATLGALLTLWVTFVPCFLWIFLGAPFIERLRGSRGISAALAAITAVVVGVIASLALWFAAHVLFAGSTRVAMGPIAFDWPSISTLDAIALALTVITATLLIRYKVSVLLVLLIAAMVGVLTKLI